MNVFRDGLTQIPNSFNTLLHSLPTTSSILPSLANSFRTHPTVVDDNLPTPPPTHHSSTSSMSSGDDNHYPDRAQAIPRSLITEEWQLVLDHNASVDDLLTAVECCKQLVIKTDECSAERKWLVRHLVELRFRLNEIQEVIGNPKSCGPTTMVILGHHFVPGTLRPSASVRQFCDYCSGIIWSVVQASYSCTDCNYRVHHKCVQNVRRVCAHVAASEITEPMLDISPEIGLAMQKYKCAECNVSLRFMKTWIEARLCDYTGLYYCPSCHWNDRAPTPARVVHNWDFTPKKVCRASLQLLALIHGRADIDIEECNAKLFVYVQNLSLVRKLRQNLVYMRQYLDECRLANASKLVDHQIGAQRYLIQSARMYSMADLVAVESGSLVEQLNRVVHVFDSHIRKCDICTGKGYLCEICGNNEVMFPYDDGGLQCGECLAMYHRACWIRKNLTCTKCARMANRKREMNETNEMNDDIEKCS